jgi:YegS/Rv2252/BmrU family lipid kinase
VPNANDLPRPIILIVNTNSRRGHDNFDAAVTALKAAGIPLAEAHAVKDRAQTAELLQREIRDGSAMVIVGGGDGTLSECAGHLANSTVALGVLPMGTGNTLARSLGIPLDLDGAAKTLANGHVTTMDVGRVNGRVFLNSVTLGFSAEIATALDKKTKKRLGVLSWPVIGAKVFLRHRALLLRVISADEKYHVRTHQMVIANGRYIAGPVAAAPDASIQDHHLDVFVLGGAKKRALVRAALQWLRGNHVQSDETRYFRTREVRIESLRGAAPADIDGEIDDSTPLDIYVEPHALRIVVPQGFDGKTV